MPTARAQRRLSKHDLKTDSFTTSIFAAREWVEANLRTALIVAAGVIAMAAIVWGVVAWRSAQTREAMALFGEAGVEMRSGNPAVAIAQLQKVLDEHSGAKVAGPACFQLAELQFRQRNFDDARVLFQRYLDDYGDDPMLKAAAWAGLGAVDEQANSPEEASAKFQKAYEVDPKGFRAPEYLHMAIRAAITANDSTKALDTFTTLRREFPRESQTLNQVRQALIEHGYLDPGARL
ncbi:MAG: tetratricopeptide repeat protein [Candidatus Zixiibacteriota bacterium]